MKLFIDILTIAYGMGGVVCFIGYIPTMHDLWLQKPSANVSTYLIWTTTTMLTSLYGFFVLNNIVFDIVVNLQLLACLIVLVMRIKLGLKLKVVK